MSETLHVRPHASAGFANPFIAKLGGFAALSEADRVLLEAVSAGPGTVPARTDIVRVGDAPGDLHLILDGMACDYKLRRNGARQIMAYRVPGDLCDLDVALLDRIDRSIGTLRTCRVARIGADAVEAMMARPAIARALRLSVCVDGAIMREWLLNVGRRSGVERLAHLLCELLARLQRAGLTQGEQCELPLTQIDLADTTGQTSVHVNRVLQDLRRRGLIDLRSRRLTIRDPAGLRYLAEFDPAYLRLGMPARPATAEAPSGRGPDGARSGAPQPAPRPSIDADDPLSS